MDLFQIREIDNINNTISVQKNSTIVITMNEKKLISPLY